MSESTKPRKKIKSFNMKLLRISLKYRPKILKLIIKMRQCIKSKNIIIKNLKFQLKQKEKSIITEDVSTQTDEKCKLQNTEENVTTSNKALNSIDKESDCTKESAFVQDVKELLPEIVNIDQNNVNKVETGWNVQNQGEKSIAEQVKEAAQTAMQQSGMVYVESAGMYYDYKTGYYYNSNLGLYYHSDTDCYYYYSEEKQAYVFHSYPDRTVKNPALEAHEKKKARKHKMESEDAEGIKPKRKKISKTKTVKVIESTEVDKEKKNEDSKLETVVDDVTKRTDNVVNEDDCTKDDESIVNKKELEDGECSDTTSESSDEDDDSNASTATASDDDSIAKHHPPCMRIIVRSTNLPKLKVGTLFLVTKDGGTIGREGDQHTIIIKDHNVSRNHLDIKYDTLRNTYTATDLGSKNGTVLNGTRMSESLVVSDPLVVMHGSTMQLGETKLLCHIHPGNDTCGHCEPGLIMETQEKEKKAAYTRTCSVQMQHQLELARLKNKYAPQPLSIEETAYNDRAKTRRDTVGSSHHSEKTRSSDLDTYIAPGNKGFKMLEKMGWTKGEGLGKDNQGDTEPVPLVTNEGTAGLGNVGAVSTPSLVPTKVTGNTLGPATLRLASRTKMLNPPAKAFQDPDMDEESE